MEFISQFLEQVKKFLELYDKATAGAIILGAGIFAWAWVARASRVAARERQAADQRASERDKRTDELIGKVNDTHQKMIEVQISQNDTMRDLWRESLKETSLLRLTITDLIGRMDQRDEQTFKKIDEVAKDATNLITLQIKTYRDEVAAALELEAKT